MALKTDKESKPDLYVVARFLEKLIANGGSRRKTELQMAVGLNFNIYSKYIEWLTDKQIIHIVEEDERSKYVSLTPKGLEVYKTLIKSIKEIVGSS